MHYTEVDTTKPLVATRASVLAGNPDLQPTTLPDLSCDIALDFETCPLPEWNCIKKASLDPHLSRIRSVQVSDGELCWFIDTFYVDGWEEWLIKLLNKARTVIAHNAKFEAKNVHVHFGRQPNIVWRCTYQASILVEYTQKHSLESVALRWANFKMDKAEQTGDWSKPRLSFSQVLYGLRDVAPMHECHNRLVRDLDNRGMLDLYENVECELIKPLAEIEVTGLPVNTKYVAEKLEVMEAEVAGYATVAQDVIFRAYKKYGSVSRLKDILWKAQVVSRQTRIPLPNNLKAPGDIPLSNNQALMQYFFAIVGPNGPILENNSIDKTSLFDCVERAELELDGETVNLVWRLLEYKHEYKRLEFLRKLNVQWSPTLPAGQACRHPVTNRIHTEIKSAVTGRMIATSGSGSEDADEDLMGDSKTNKDQPWLMNVQQFPRDPSVRQAFGFEGYVVELDENGISKDAGFTPVMNPDGSVKEWEEHGAWSGGIHNGEEWSILSADYSALEAFILAHLSQDPGMIEAVTSKDFHSTNASKIYGVPADEVPGWMRQVTKNVTYCTAYGGGAPKIAQTANMAFIEKRLPNRITEAEAQEAQTRYFAAYPKVEPFLEREFKHVLRYGWTRPTKLGRIRNINAEIEYDRIIKKKRSNARTKAFNNPMQMSNADIIKRAILSLYRFIVDNYPSGVELGPPIHDEQLLFSLRSLAGGLGAAMAERMKSAMDFVLSDEEGHPTFNVPVKPSYGPSWGHAH